jgi:hypothetical protein
MCAWVVAGGAERRKPDGLLHSEAIRGMLTASQELKKEFRFNLVEPYMYRNPSRRHQICVHLISAEADP